MLDLLVSGRLAIVTGIYKPSCNSAPSCKDLKLQSCSAEGKCVFWKAALTCWNRVSSKQYSRFDPYDFLRIAFELDNSSFGRSDILACMKYHRICFDCCCIFSTFEQEIIQFFCQETLPQLQMNLKLL